MTKYSTARFVMLENTHAGPSFEIFKLSFIAPCVMALGDIMIGAYETVSSLHRSAFQSSCSELPAESLRICVLHRRGFLL